MDKDFIHDLAVAIGLVVMIGGFGFAVGFVIIKLVEWCGGLLGLPI